MRTRTDGKADPRHAAHASTMALAKIVRREDLRVVFQPIVHLEGGAVFAYEALVRCDDPFSTEPSTLVRNAELSGCVGLLGRMIREIAVPSGAGERLFVNVHPMELDSHWLARPDDPIFFHDREIYMEVTEDAPLVRAPRYREMIDEIRSRGVHIVVDDFGSGYANFDWLARLEPAVVKLDRQLVTQVHGSARRLQLVKSIVRLCADLGARVVAEGIELPDELSVLRDVGVHYGQGYLLGRPGCPRSSPLPAAH